MYGWVSFKLRIRLYKAHYAWYMTWSLWWLLITKLMTSYWFLTVLVRSVVGSSRLSTNYPTTIHSYITFSSRWSRWDFQLLRFGHWNQNTNIITSSTNEGWWDEKYKAFTSWLWLRARAQSRDRNLLFFNVVPRHQILALCWALGDSIWQAS